METDIERILRKPFFAGAAGAFVASAADTAQAYTADAEFATS